MGGGGAGPPANRGPRVVARAYKAAISGIFFSFSADYAAASLRGCRGRVLSLPGLLWNEAQAPSLKTLVHCRCVSTEGKQRSSLLQGWRHSGWLWRAKMGDAGSWVGPGRNWCLPCSAVRILCRVQGPVDGSSSLIRNSDGIDLLNRVSHHS